MRRLRRRGGKPTEVSVFIDCVGAEHLPFVIPSTDDVGTRRDRLAFAIVKQELRTQRLEPLQRLRMRNFPPSCDEAFERFSTDIRLVVGKDVLLDVPLAQLLLPVREYRLDCIAKLIAGVSKHNLMRRRIGTDSNDVFECPPHPCISTQIFS